MKKHLDSLRFLTLYLVYFVMFSFTAAGKFASGGVPEWFTKQFGGTVLNLFPGALFLQFYSIATLEALAALIFLVGILRFEFMPNKNTTFLSFGLSLAFIIFIILEVGLQLTHDFNTAVQVFTYFGFTWFFQREAVLKA